MTKAIDIWVNPFTPEIVKRDWIDYAKKHPDLEQGLSRWGILKRVGQGFTPAEYIAQMNEIGVDKSFIPSFKMGSYFPPGEFWMNLTNEEIKNIVDQYPDRLAGLCGINPMKRMEGVKELERAVKDYGFIGAHQHPFEHGPINDRIWYPYYAKCVELDIPIVCQVGAPGGLQPSANGRPILIDDVALYFPDLRFVACHTGWPWVEELICMAEKHPNVYIATTAHLPKYFDPSLVRFLNSRGQNKVLWGSDWPITSPRDSLALIEEMDLKKEAKEKYLRENAIRVFYKR